MRYLKKGGKHLFQERQLKYTFILENVTIYSVEKMCKCMGVSKNVLIRDFSSLKLGEKWVSDITYIRVNNDWNYLTTVLDLADRKIVDWSLSQDMTTENTVAKA